RVPYRYSTSLLAFSAPLPTAFYPLSLHDALPILFTVPPAKALGNGAHSITAKAADSVGNTSVASDALALTVDLVAPIVLSINRRSEEHTSELQSPYDLVCRLLLEKKKQSTTVYTR